MKVGLEQSGAEKHGIFEQSLHAERGTASGNHAFFSVLCEDPTMLSIGFTA